MKKAPAETRSVYLATLARSPFSLINYIYLILTNRRKHDL